MKAMILAAGRGERLKPLTDTTPKPLLKAGDKSLIEYHLTNLAAAGIKDVVINIAWLGEQIKQALGDGEKYQLNITYSDEGEQALETAGGIINALPLLGDEPFMVINGDIWTDYPLRVLREQSLSGGALAHLVMVDNPGQHSHGDFVMGDSARLHLAGDGGGTTLTYAGIAIYHPALFAGIAPGKLPLRPVLDRAIAARQISCEHYRGGWEDVGTPDRLQALDERLALP
jgi:MurNAc alpha-1-phosphate uridylyltransferase